jgi:hypothetical protein
VRVQHDAMAAYEARRASLQKFAAKSKRGGAKAASIGVDGEQKTQ